MVCLRTSRAESSRYGFLLTTQFRGARNGINPWTRTARNPLAESLEGGPHFLFAPPVRPLARRLEINRYPVINETSIRDGMLYALTGLSNSESLNALDQDEAMRGHALSCSLFSSIAIGGLVLGHPEASVARHVDVAKASVKKFEGLSDQSAVSALLLYALLDLILRHGKPGEEYHKYRNRSKAVFDSLPERDPVISTLFTYRTLYDGLLKLSMEAAYSVDPISILQEKQQTSEHMGANTATGEAILQYAETGAPDPGGTVASAMPLQIQTASREAHPACVVTDGECSRAIVRPAGASSLGAGLVILSTPAGTIELMPGMHPAALYQRSTQDCIS